MGGCGGLIRGRGEGGGLGGGGAGIGLGWIGFGLDLFVCLFVESDLKWFDLESK